MFTQNLQPSCEFLQGESKTNLDYLGELWILHEEIFMLKLKIARLEASNTLQDVRIKAMQIFPII
jgi:hypothetical protein